MLAPVAVNVLLCVAHMVTGLGVIVKVGFGLTVNVTVWAALVQEFILPVTV